MAYDLTIFKDYDIRGIYPSQINAKTIEAIAYAVTRKFSPKNIALCRDMRISGKELRDAFVEVFTKLGVNVYDAGLTGTEMQYFIAATKPYDLVLMISASHNPPEYNGLKLVLKGPVAVTSESGLYEIRDTLDKEALPDSQTPGTITMIDVTKEWKNKIHSLIDIKMLKPLTVVADAGNGMAGLLIPKAFDGLPFHVIPLYFELDGRFPNHVPNPLVESNNKDLIAKVLEVRADVGITFDGDADRMFLIDDKGRFVSGTITTALLSRYILKKHPGERVLYNAICGKIVPETIEKFGGVSQRVRVGHSYIKTYMRETNAIFAGEHSGHYYYRDFFSAESGALSSLMILSLLSSEQKKLSELVDELSVYPSSGEINFAISDIAQTLAFLKNDFSDAKSIDEVDGISVWYDQYWFNVRGSKTEPLLRLNVEADTRDVLKHVTETLIKKIESTGGIRK